jgi:hypothetical protein
LDAPFAASAARWRQGRRPAGLLDDDPDVRPRLHVFTSSKAPWWEIADDLPQHAKWVPGYEPKQP